MRKRAQYLHARQGQRRRGSFVRLEAIRRLDEEKPQNARVGFTVSKKNGNAVRRNRIKRRLRAAVRHCAADVMLPHHDYVIIATPNAHSAPFDALCADVRSVIEAANRRLAAQPKNGE